MVTAFQNMQESPPVRPPSSGKTCEMTCGNNSGTSSEKNSGSTAALSTGSVGGPTIEVQLMTIAGQVVGVVVTPVDWTTQQLKAHLCEVALANKEAGPNAVSLVRTDESCGILPDKSIVGKVLPTPIATVYLIQRNVQVRTAKDISGAHTSNPSYFSREDEGTNDEALELKDVCWFQVGATFHDVAAGTYSVFVEAAASSAWRGFPMTVEPTKEEWNPKSQLTAEFQKFRVSELMVDEATAEVRVNLVNTSGNWKQGIKLRSISLE